VRQKHKIYTLSSGVQKIVTYVNCAYWINPGIATYLTKGSLAECTGGIGVNTLTGKDGDVKATLTFHVNNIKLHGVNKGIVLPHQYQQ
jgi:single-strand DNA-binding protein